jgi:hypothetical protein
MNAGVALVQSYLRLNGFFTLTDVPIIRRGRKGQYHELTDVDILAIRPPGARTLVSRGEPGIDDDLVFQGDPRLELGEDVSEVLIAEVKIGKPRINPGLLAEETLSTAVARVGICPDAELGSVVARLQASGEAYVHAAGGEARFRLMAFGAGRSARRRRYAVFSLADVAEFLRAHLHRYREILTPVETSDPTLALLHLLDKLD